MKKQHTQRGFGIYEFKSADGDDCIIQESSLSTGQGACIWLGAKELKIEHFKAGQGWNTVEYVNNTEEHYVGNERMHLNREQVKAILPILQKFVDTGEI